MRDIRRNNKSLRIAVVLAAALLTATILTATVTTTTNQNQNTYPLINLYLLGVSQNPNNAIILPKEVISSSITFEHNYSEIINVAANDIVINGNGYYVLGPGSGSGFYLNGRSNVTIFNVTVTGWQYGFYLNGSSNNNLTGNNATNNTAGFYLSSSSYNTLSDNTANNTEEGFILASSSYNTLSDNTANNNTIYGFFLASSSNNNNLTGNNAYNNTEAGFTLLSSSYNTLSDNNAYNNTGTGTGTGFALYDSSDSSLTGNTANNNTNYGFYLSSSSNNNNLTGNNATNNNRGFSLDPNSNYNTLSDNTATSNTRGFYLYNNAYNTLSDNTATSNTRGFYLYQSSNNLTGNTANSNTEAGFHLYSSANNNNLSGNTAYNNSVGFYLQSSSNNNNLTGNIATNNNYGFSLISCTGNNLRDNIALNSTTGGYGWSDDSINNNFTGSVVAYHLLVNVTDSGGLPFPGAQARVVSDSMVVSATTGVNGSTPWFGVPYRTFVTNDTTALNNNTLTVSYSTLWEIAIFSNNPRTVDMSTQHTENFTLTSMQPSALQTLLPVLLLAGTQGGTSPLVYAALGIAGVAAVAAVLFYYLRIRR